MIPIRDTIRSKNFPVVNTCIIAINVLVFLIQLTQGREFDYIYGLMPARYTVPEIGRLFTFEQQVIALFSFMFLHGGFWHLLSNMWSLYIFGDNIEDRLGHVRYLVFYLLCGLASGFVHVLFNFHSHILTVGASGAIAGVMGAYLISYPNSRILTFVFLFIVEIPAYIFLGIWFLMQLLNAPGSSTQGGGIAWWAHIGGFIAGVIFLKLFLILPKSGINKKLQAATSRKKTSGLQMIRTFTTPDDPNLNGDIVISPFEAMYGTRKLVNIPWGFQRRLFRVNIPPGIKNGSVLRLRGMGKTMAGNIKGDMFLKVFVHE